MVFKISLDYGEPMRAAGKSGTVELEIQIGTELAVVTVSVHAGEWMTMLDQHVSGPLRLTGEPTTLIIPASPDTSDTRPREAAIIRAIYRPG